MTVLVNEMVTASGTEISVSVVNSVKVLRNRQQLITISPQEGDAEGEQENKKHCKARRVGSPVSRCVNRSPDLVSMSPGPGPGQWWLLLC